MYYYNTHLGFVLGVRALLCERALLGCTGYLAHKKHPPRRTLQKPYAQGPMVILWGWVFLMSEEPL